MTEMHYFKSIPGTNYAKAINEYFTIYPRWGKVIERVAELLDEPVTRIAFDAEELYVSLDEIENPKNQSMFTKDGRLARNRVLANECRKNYLSIIEEEGLSEFRNLGRIHFTYGLMRSRGQSMDRYVTSDNTIYFKCDFDLASGNAGLVEPISSVEYAEQYLIEMKIREDEKEKSL